MTDLDLRILRQDVARLRKLVRRPLVDVPAVLVEQLADMERQLAAIEAAKTERPAGAPASERRVPHFAPTEKTRGRRLFTAGAKPRPAITVEELSNALAR